MTVEHHGNMETDAYFEDGYYGSAKTLVRALNDGVKGGSVKFSHDPVTQKVCVHMKGDTTFALYGDLPDVLGFGRGDGVVIRTSNRKTVVQGHSIVDLRRGFESLYVYSSIVEPRIVGDKIAPLLRIVPITGRHGEMVAARFDHVQYMPVLSREFEAVEIEIRDDTGRPVPFERGKVTMTLHLRRHRRTGLFLVLHSVAANELTKDELRRLLRATSGWRVAILCGRTRPARARVRQFVWGPPPIGCTADQTRSAGARESCIKDWRANCW